jgi:hypothetical protein
MYVVKKAILREGKKILHCNRQPEITNLFVISVNRKFICHFDFAQKKIKIASASKLKKAIKL